jgi:hypothetical protein
MSGNRNIVVTKGDTFNFNFRVDIDGVAWDLTSYTGRMQVRRSTLDTNKLLDTATNGAVVLDASGNVSVSVPATFMSTVPTGRWLYDFQLTSGSEVTTILAGRFIVQAEVTF